MASSASSRTPGSLAPSTSKDTAASSSSGHNPMGGSSKAQNDESEASKVSQSSLHGKEAAEASSNSPDSPDTGRSRRLSLDGSGDDGLDEERGRKLSVASEAVDDEEDDEDEKEDEMKHMSKRNSTHKHKDVNLHTECGRHSDDWLFAPLADTVKSLLGKKDHK